MGLIYISLMTRDAKHLFIKPLVNMSSLEKYLFMSSAHFFNWIICLEGVEFYKFFIDFGY